MVPQFPNLPLADANVGDLDNTPTGSKCHPGSNPGWSTISSGAILIEAVLKSRLPYV